MNIEIANRLVELRKKSGLSQEELADKLGLSRQAVSKWERAEASPDTDNLICLAKLYNVSLDDLLKTDVPVDDIVREQKERTEEKKAEEEKHEEKKDDVKDKKRSDHVHISPAGIHVSSADGEEVHISAAGIHIDDNEGTHVHMGPKDAREFWEEHKTQHKVLGIVSSVTTLLVVVAYLLVGFLINTPWTYGDSNSGWCIGWILFFLVPIVPSILEAIFRHRVSKFALPALVTGVYLFLGMYLGLWHPTWVMFFAIPVFYSIVKPIEHCFDSKMVECKCNIKGDVVMDIKDDEDEDKDE